MAADGNLRVSAAMPAHIMGTKNSYITGKAGKEAFCALPSLHFLTALRRLERPLLVVAAHVAPLMDRGAIGSGGGIDIHALAGLNRSYAVVATARRGNRPPLVRLGEVIPNLDLRAISRRLRRNIERTPALNSDDFVNAVAQMRDGPFLVIAAAVAPLMHRRAVGGCEARNVQAFAAVTGHDLVGAVGDWPSPGRCRAEDFEFVE